MVTKQDWHLPTINEEYNALCRLPNDVSNRVALGEVSIMASEGTLVAYEPRPKAKAIQVHYIIRVDDLPIRPDFDAAREFIKQESETWQCPTILA